MKIYISGKITGTSDYMQNFKTMQDELERKGHEVINPALINSFLPQNTTWEQYMSLCYPMIDMCDAVYMMNGWEDSRGATLEYEYAIKNKKFLNLI